MKRLLTIILALALVLCMALPASANKETAGEAAKARADALEPDQKVLNIFTWTYYVPDEVVNDFMDATGITVNYASMIDNEDVLPKLSAGGAQYDVIVCSDVIIPDLTAAGLLNVLDRSKIPNFENIGPVYQSQYYDSDNQYTIPYTNTVPLIVYDPTAVDFEVTGYTDLWREEFEGGLALVGYWRNVIGMAQKKLGYSYNDEDPAHLQEVAEELKALKPNIAVLNDSTPHNALISGDAIAGFMYGSQIVAAQEMLPQLKVVYPAEGAGYGIDCMVMPADAPHMEAAYIFLDYMLDGEVSAYASELIQYGNCNIKAPAFMSDTYLNNETVVIPQEVIEAAEIMKPLSSEAQALYNQVWTEFLQ